MRYPLILLVLSSLAFTAEPAFIPTAPWTAATVDGVPGFALDFPGTGSPPLTVEVAVEANSPYAVEFRLKNSLPDVDQTVLFRVKAELQYGRDLRTGPAWGLHRIYFHSGTATTARIWLHPSPGAAKHLEVTGLKLVKLAPQDLQANLLPQGDLEQAAAHLPNWGISPKVNAFTAAVVPCEGFKTGERSLRLERSQGDPSDPTIHSVGLPVVLGGDAELSFWAKAKAETTVSAGVNGWFSPHAGDHFYKLEKVKVGTEWKPFTVKVNIPSDLTTYPDLKSRLVMVRFSLPQDQASSVLFDDITFMNVKK